MEIKKVKLDPGTPYANHMKVDVLDFPKGEGALDENGKELTRKRCEIDVEYGDSDIQEMKKRGIDSVEAGVEFYRNWMYELVKTLLSFEWEAVSGLEETLKVVRTKLETSGLLEK